MGKPKRAADVISQVLKAGGLKAGLERGRAVTLWPEIAGPGLAEMTEAERLEDGVLFVRVSDTVVGHQLTYMREEFVKRYRERLPGSVRELRFQVGRQNGPAKPKAKPAALPALDEAEVAGLRKMADKSPEDLQKVILRAGKAVLQSQKANPHPPCRICGVPGIPNPCKRCQKLFTEPAVLKEATRLTRFPLRPKLEGDPLGAARHLAAEKLEAQLRDLLPQAVQQPDLIPILQDTARRYLQLKTGEKEVAPHRHLLPDSLQSLLKEI